MSEEPKVEDPPTPYWVNIRQAMPNQYAPVNVANYRRQWLPYLCYVDDQQMWRQYHSKLPAPEVDWWMQLIPAFPPFDVPEEDQEEEIMRLRKIIKDQDAEMKTLRKL